LSKESTPEVTSRSISGLMHSLAYNKLVYLCEL